MILVFGSWWFHGGCAGGESSLDYIYVCVCVLACLDYVAGWTHMTQEIEPHDQEALWVRLQARLLPSNRGESILLYILSVETKL